MRRAARRDKSEAGIVKALEAVGAFVYRLTQPVDLLVYYRERWFLLECKTTGVNRPSKTKTEGQRVFCQTFGVPIVTSIDAALAAIGAVRADHPIAVTATPMPQ